MARHELVICTRNRASDVAQCLDRVNACTVVPDRVIVVDSSDTDETQRTVEMQATDGRNRLRTRYVRADPGLTHQRNVGLAELTENCEIVHFIDDDSRVSERYFDEILRGFAASSTAVGVGGYILPLGAPPRVGARGRIGERYRRIFLLRPRPGRVSRSGRNALYRVPPDDLTRVEWLSGCAMSFVAPLAKQLRFDESLGGYGLGEDMEFSSRMAKFGPLILNPQATLQHLVSPANRLQIEDMFHRDVVNRYYFHKKRPEDFGLFAFGWSLLGMAGEASLGLFGSSRPESFAEFRGLTCGVQELAARRFRAQSGARF